MLTKEDHRKMEVEQLQAAHNRLQHYFAGEPECVFCGCFGPIEDGDPCVSREQIGKQVAFLQDKLYAIQKVVNASYPYCSSEAATRRGK